MSHKDPLGTHRARGMGSYVVPQSSGHGKELRYKRRSKRSQAPLSGRRIRIRPDSRHLRAGLVGRLTYVYNLRTGAYYALLDGQGLETVVRSHEWELLEDAA